ncbi:MAG TPA: glycosyltransferase family 39 protein [Phycisphaerae bacterium]|nr:glycosyltransferase family 39 protein [Phycisphaerae bacterium]
MTAHVDQSETTTTPLDVCGPSVQTGRRRMLLWGLGLAVLLAVTRLPSMGFYPLNVDETIYAAVAVRCNYLHQPPYVGAVDNKGPLLFWLYQLVFVLTGDYNIAVTHVVGAIVVALNALMVWHITSRCFGPRAGPLGALLYLLVMASDWDFLAFNAELPASLPLVAANWLVLTSRKRPNAARCLLAGAMAITAAGFRQNCLIAFPIVCIGAGAMSWACDRRMWPAFGRVVLVGVGGLIPVLIVAWVYHRHDAVAELMFYYLGHNTKYYISAVPWHPARLVVALWQGAMWLHKAAVINLLVMIGLLPALWRRAANADTIDDTSEFAVVRAKRVYVAILAITLWAGICVGMRFFYHYRILDWPFSSVLAAGGWMFLIDQLRQRHARAALKAAGAVLLAAFGVGGDSMTYLAGLWEPKMAPIHVESHVLATGLRLRANTTQADSVFVWGMQPQIYTFAQRRMATRFPQCNALVGLVHFENYFPLDQDRSASVWPGSSQQLMTDLAADPPAYVVDASGGLSFAMGRYPIDYLPEVAAWLEANYVFDFEQPAPAADVLRVYRRRDRAPTDTSEPLPYCVLGQPFPSPSELILEPSNSSGGDEASPTLKGADQPSDMSG